MADDLYRRLFGLVQSWARGDVNPLLTVTQQYAWFLMGTADRWSEAPAAIERYQDLLISTHGAGTGSLAEALRMTIDYQRAHGSYHAAIRAAQDLLDLKESLAGKTGEPSLNALETLAQLYEGNNDPAAAVQLRRRAAAIADLLSAHEGGAAKR